MDATMEDTTRQGQKLRFELLKLRPEVFLLWMAAAFILLTTFGGLLLFVYLMRHQFNPGGIAAGDTLSLAAIALGYLFFMAVTLLVSTVAAFPVVRVLQPLFAVCGRTLEAWRLRRMPPAEELVPGGDRPIGSAIQLRWKKGRWSYFLMGILFLLFLVAGFGASWSLPLIVYVAYMAAAGSLLSMLFFGEFRHEYCRLPRFREPSRMDRVLEAMPLWRRQIVVVGTVIAVLSALVVGEFQDAAFRIVGFRASDVSIRLAKDDFLGLVEEATEAGVALNACQPLRPELLRLNHVDVMLHKIGSSALLRYPSTPEFFDRNAPHLPRHIRFEPLNSNITPMQRNSPKEKCDELLLEYFFAAGGLRISAETQRMLTVRLGRLAALSADEKVVVTVYDEGNGTAARSQAGAIGEFLQRAYGLNPAKLFVGVGAIGKVVILPEKKRV